ncbi:RNA ligase family protein [Labrenzia sp. VG12]|uniref:RNA ligase family protein n=1 Tax=Labrenzia sp. VG12 TaxID=2021862 RepID=UPI000B8C0FB3|nr:RNA ligase family protein [Labrenzia sp. VG12]ASP36696.1 DNA ligase [Labrenzia sp. VG12]
MELIKYPRTRHLEGSRLQQGDLSDDQPVSGLAGRNLVIEEKIDGANCAVSFDQEGQLQLQSRGHFLVGGHRERHFDLLKTWASAHAHRFREVLGMRYVMYGEWLYAKHTVFYDRLPHFFLEFDLLDRETGRFLSTAARRDILFGLPVMPVPVVFEGEVGSVEQIEGLVKPSLYKSPDWRKALREAALASGNRPDMVDRQTEDSDLAEGLYVKQEVGEAVTGRFKFVRADFIQAITEADGHWQSRPILPNRLAEGIDIFAPELAVKGAYDDPDAI